jgi:hypothetical protein
MINLVLNNKIKKKIKNRLKLTWLTHKFYDLNYEIEISL